MSTVMGDVEYCGAMLEHHRLHPDQTILSTNGHKPMCSQPGEKDHRHEMKSLCIGCQQRQSGAQITGATTEDQTAGQDLNQIKEAAAIKPAEFNTTMSKQLKKALDERLRDRPEREAKRKQAERDRRERAYTERKAREEAQRQEQAMATRYLDKVTGQAQAVHLELSSAMFQPARAPTNEDYLRAGYLPEALERPWDSNAPAQLRPQQDSVQSSPPQASPPQEGTAQTRPRRTGTLRPKAFLPSGSNAFAKQIQCDVPTRDIRPGVQGPVFQEKGHGGHLHALTQYDGPAADLDTGADLADGQEPGPGLEEGSQLSPIQVRYDTLHPSQRPKVAQEGSTISHTPMDIDEVPLGTVARDSLMLADDQELSPIYQGAYHLTDSSQGIGEAPSSQEAPLMEMDWGEFITSLWPCDEGPPPQGSESGSAGAAREPRSYQPADQFEQDSMGGSSLQEDGKAQEEPEDKNQVKGEAKPKTSSTTKSKKKLQPSDKQLAADRDKLAAERRRSELLQEAVVAQELRSAENRNQGNIQGRSSWDEPWRERCRRDAVRDRLNAQERQRRDATKRAKSSGSFVGSRLNRGKDGHEK